MKLLKQHKKILREIYKGENQMMKDMRKFIEDPLNIKKFNLMILNLLVSYFKQEKYLKRINITKFNEIYKDRNWFNQKIIF